MKIRRCPRCDNSYEGYAAVSRRDNKTKICGECGLGEALFDWAVSCAKTDEERKKQLRASEQSWLVVKKRR